MKNTPTVEFGTKTQERFLLITLLFIAFFILGGGFIAQANNDKGTNKNTEEKTIAYNQNNAFAVKILDNNSKVPVGSKVNIKGIAPKVVDASGKIYITNKDIEVLSAIWDGNIPFTYKGNSPNVKVFYLSYPLIPPSVINFE